MLENCRFKLEMKVRDYECDMQGIVNNANYQHYMEHARHEFLENEGGSFAKLTEQGIYAMVSKITINYKSSLRSSDRFVVCLDIERRGIKLVFKQNIYRCSDDQLCTSAEVETICAKDGKLTRGEIFKEIFGI